MDPALEFPVEDVLGLSASACNVTKPKESASEDSESDDTKSEDPGSEADWTEIAAGVKPWVNKDLDWQLNKPVTDCLLYMLTERRFTDISFVFPEEGPDVFLPAHKVILAGRCPYMEALFFGPVSTKNTEVKITNYTHESFFKFIKFLYTDDINLTEHASEILRISHEYRVPQLTGLCIDYLSNHLDKENVLDVLETAQYLTLKDLEQRTLLFIDSHAADVLATEAFSEIPHATVARIIQRETLSTPEINVYKAASKWAEAECKRKCLEPTGCRRREILGRVLNLIRMSQVDPPDLADIVVRDGMLSQDETWQLFMYHAATEKPSLDAFPNTAKRSSPYRLLLCQNYDTDTEPLKGLEEDISLLVNNDCTLMGVILTKITTSSGNPLDLIRGSLTVLNDGDEPKQYPFAVSFESVDEDTFDVSLEKPIFIRKDKQYQIILSSLTGADLDLPYTKKTFLTRMGKYPAGNANAGQTKVTLTQSGPRRTRFTPLVGLLLVP